jgi:hypothetical protein
VKDKMMIPKLNLTIFAGHLVSFAGWFLLATGAAVVGGLALTQCNKDNGIYDHPSGETIYLLGSGCIIGMTPERSVNDMNAEYIWCMEQHLDYLSELQK